MKVVTFGIVLSLILEVGASLKPKHAEPLPNVRPPYAERTFHSSAVDAYIAEYAPQISNPDLATLFSNALPNTLDTTVFVSDGRNDTFIITGDISALWLRDSTNQVLPYMRFAAQDQSLADLICGLVRRQARSVLIDAFANSFNFNASGDGHQHDTRNPPMTPDVFEGASAGGFVMLRSWRW